VGRATATIDCARPALQQNHGRSRALFRGVHAPSSSSSESSPPLHLLLPVSVHSIKFPIWPALSSSTCTIRCLLAASFPSVVAGACTYFFFR
jgi:hypothetical protein